MVANIEKNTKEIQVTLRERYAYPCSIRKMENEKIDLTMIELFSGIGAQKRGTDLTNLFNCKVIATSDIDKDAMVSYAAIHNGLTNDMIDLYSEYPSEDEMKQILLDRNIGFDFKKRINPIKRLKGNKLKKYYLAMIISNNLGDISKIGELPLADFWTYSFPCQDIFVCGKQMGIVKGKTRSGLLYEVERLLEKAKESNTLPKYLLLENVKNLVGKRFIDRFNDWLKKLEELGYNTYWEVTNAKNCGVIPQNRERTFALSIRKDIDTKKFIFAKPYDLGCRLRDFLEVNVDKKYYLSQEIQDRLQITDKSFAKNVIGTTKPNFKTIGQRDLVYQKDGVIGALVATDYKQPKQILESSNELKQIMTLSGGKWDKIHESCRRVYSENGIAPTLHTCGGGNTEPKVVFEERRDEGVRYFKGDYIGTLRTIDSCGDKRVAEYKDNKIVVRKLTPKESWRLMGFSDDCYEKAVAVGLSDSSGYKQAGNSIVTYCIKQIMEHLYKAQYNNEYMCFDEKILISPSNKQGIKQIENIYG